MTRVKFYCDVPPYSSDAWIFNASSSPLVGARPEGWTRVSFYVELPTRHEDVELAPERVSDSASEVQK